MVKQLSELALDRFRREKHGQKTWLVHRLIDMLRERDLPRVLVTVTDDGVVQVYGSPGLEVTVAKVGQGVDVRDVVAGHAGQFGEIRWEGVPAVTKRSCAVDDKTSHQSWRRAACNWLRIALVALSRYEQAKETANLAQEGRWDLWKRQPISAASVQRTESTPQPAAAAPTATVELF